MTKKKKYLSGSVLLVFLLAITWAAKEYNRKPASILSSAPAYRLSAVQLISEYEGNEELADKKYLGKIIEVTGTLASTTNEGDTLTTYFLGPAGGSKNVSCLIAHYVPVTENNLSPGKLLTIKGICTGNLMDVELNQCIVVTK